MTSRKVYELQQKNFKADLKKAGVGSKQDFIRQNAKISTAEKKFAEKLDEVVEKVEKLDKLLRSEINELKSRKAEAKQRLFKHNTKKLKKNIAKSPFHMMYKSGSTTISEDLVPSKTSEIHRQIRKLSKDIKSKEKKFKKMML